jgi:hypothetical protein
LRGVLIGDWRGRRLATEHTDQWSGCGRNGHVVLGRDGGVSLLNMDDDAPAIGVDGVGVCTIHVDDHAGDRRIGVVQANADAVDTVGIQRKMFLFRVRESPWKGENEPIGIRRRLNRRLHSPGQDNFDSYIRALALNLQLLNLGRAAFGALSCSEGRQE